MLSNLMQSVTEDLPTEGDVHLWLARPEDVSEDWLHAISRDVLPNIEIEKSCRYHFSRDRRSFLLTRILQRTVLSRYHPTPPRDWTFSTNPFGRPFIVTPHGDRLIQFNISHTGGLIALAVGCNLQIGLDVERLCRAGMQTEIADRFFAESEAVELRSLPMDLRNRRFLEFWTLKEAYLKAKARGLSIPLDSFAFSLTPGSIRFSVENDQGNDEQGWEFVQFDAFDEHLGAVCTSRRRAAPLRLIAREVIPFEWERPIDLKITRRSY